MTSTGRSEALARKTRDLAIWATSQPTWAAASAELRVVSANSTTSASRPISLRSACTRAAAGRRLAMLARQLSGAPGRCGDGPVEQRLHPILRHQDIERLEGRALGAGHVAAELLGRFGREAGKLARARDGDPRQAQRQIGGQARLASRFRQSLD